MPKKTRRVRRTNTAIAHELDTIQSIIGDHPDGIGLTSVMAAFAKRTDRPLLQRTMVRRLRDLQDQGRVYVSGHTTAARYYARATPIPVPTFGPSASRSESISFENVPLSSEGAAALALIQRPLAARRPVGYNEGFLRAYEPGQTWYLESPARDFLHAIGRTPDENRPAGTFARDIFERLLIDLAWASSRLEGNTYSRLDTERLFETGQRAVGKDAAEAQMLLNHKKAIELLVDQAANLQFNRYTLFNLHAALAENLIGDARDEGRIRSRLVSITSTTYTPLGIPQKLEELFDVLLEKTRGISDPFEQAFFVMVHLPYLQPFADVNKRTLRLAANIPLIKANLCPLSFVDVPNAAYVDGTLAVYEYNRVGLLRDVFMWAYQRSCAQYRVIREAMGEPDPLRLRYKQQLAAVVRETVLDAKPPRLRNLRTWASQHGIPTEDGDSFAEIAFRLLVDLHEGAIARYNLLPSQFEEWKSTIKTSMVDV